MKPTPAELPFELAGYQPDLLARKGQGGILVAVRESRADRLSVDQLISAADEVKKHPGWRLVLVTQQDIVPDELQVAQDENASWDEIADRIRQARRLQSTGDNEAAFLILWIALERLLRIQAREAAIPVERLEPSIIIRQLYSFGELTLGQFETALECQRARNRIVHGFPAADLLLSTERLMSLVNELLTEWSATKLSN